MTGDRNDEGLLSRWARRKAEAQKEAALEAVTPEEDVPRVEDLAPGEDAGRDAREPQPEPDSEEEAMEVLRARDPELADKIAGIDVDKLAYEDDFSIFMNKKVPEFIRRRALSKLWLLSPVLANVDGLNDYDDDFTQATSALREFKSAYIPGKGYARDEDEEVADDEDALAAGDGAEDAAGAAELEDDGNEELSGASPETTLESEDEEVELGDVEEDDTPPNALKAT